MTIGSRTRWLVLLLALVVAGGPAASIVAQEATPVASPTAAGFTDAPCPFALPPNVVDGRDIACGFLAVPERHERPDGKLIQLAVAMLPPVGGEAVSSPLVILNGGPGQGSELLITAFMTPMFPAYALRQNRQIILFDQRGTGASQPSLACPEIANSDPSLTTATSEEINAQLTILANQCRDRMTGEGIDLAAYTSAQSAADVAALRQALGYEQIDLYGGSYGTRLALTILRDHPEGIRGVILDANYPLQRDLYADTPPTFNAALQGVFAGCAADPLCNLANPDLPLALQRAVARLDAEPQTVTVTPYGTTTPIDVTINGSIFLANVVFTSLYASPIIPLVPYTITAASTGNLNLTITILSLLLTNPPLSYGMYYSIQCSEEIPFANETAPATPIAAPEPMLPLIAEKFALDTSIADVCATWPTDPPNPIENQPVTSDVPALIVDGQFDPVTSPDNATLIAEDFPNSTVAIFPGAGHTLLDQPCPISIFIAFLADPATSPDLSCAATMGADFSPG